MSHFAASLPLGQTEKIIEFEVNRSDLLEVPEGDATQPHLFTLMTRQVTSGKNA
jgi:hypothetical protein